MKKIILLSTITSLFLLSCSHKINIVSEKQISLHSKQMQDSLRSFKYYRFPLIGLNDKLKLKIRTQWDTYEKWMVKDMHTRFDFTTKDTTIAGVKVVIVQPKTISQENNDVIGFHIHGGGFMMSTPLERAGLLLANEYKYKIYSVDYTLSPEVKYPVAINECLSVYKELSDKFSNKKIISSAISAGGQILQVTLLKAQSQNLKMPVVNVLFSPLLNLTFEGDSYYNNDGRDVSANKNSGDKIFKDLYLDKNANLKDPLISPVFAEYKGNFPATVFVSGTRDLLLSCSLKGFWKMKEGGIKTEMLITEGGWHASQYYPQIPEAITSRAAIYQFLDNQLVRVIK
ncbi:acetyl esterase/lipase [Tenacibaculum adriaticum]|uniref:Acetyl esterase/lipase n=1 Tax=Tenacibaculum adriaticum TaxID=413713 RepID=A0A5S5DW31_9FLAO|nr:alpha/beta hydrolase [Tenacibaculum adriaticum]TYQ00181.1 acetyl esterase/lipase [Tenacibaculum adriaticum]